MKTLVWVGSEVGPTFTSGRLTKTYDFSGGPIQVNDGDALELIRLAGRSLRDNTTFENNKKQPFALVSPSPIVLVGSGTFNGTGQLTLSTALPAIPLGPPLVYLRASNGLTAGLYKATFSSTTVCQLTEVSTTTAGAYAGGTVEALCLTLSMKGGALGVRGFLQGTLFIGSTNNANVKQVYVRIGATNIAAITCTSQMFNQSTFGFFNRGAENVNISCRPNSPVPASGTSSYYVTSALDTAVDFNINVYMQCATATDSLILEAASIMVFPTVA